MQYRKKAVIIEAIQYTGDNKDHIAEFVGNSFCGGETPHIKTLEGNMDVSYGDYIIKGVKGEFYPCKHDIFIMTYDRVKDEEDNQKELQYLYSRSQMVWEGDDQYYQGVASGYYDALRDVERLFGLRFDWLYNQD